jgi:multimeric flavodoxin WrbA
MSARLSLLAISGSERAGGNTEQVLEYVQKLAVGRDADFRAVHLRDQQIAPCGTCGDCNYRATPCDLGDDMPAVVARMIEADAIIYAVPVHAFGMAHLMQQFIERAGVGYLRFRRPLANKVGGVIVTGRRYNHTQVFNQLVLNMLLNRMVMVGSGFPALVHCGKESELWADSEGLDSVRRMVGRMLDFATVLRHVQADQPAMLPVDADNERVIAPLSSGS